MAVDTVTANGIRKNYNPPSGINNVTEIIFDPTAQTYGTGVTVAVPQGDSGGLLTLPSGDMTDTIWDGRYPGDVGGGLAGTALPGVTPRVNDAGFGHTVLSTAGGKVFTTNCVCRSLSGSVEPTAGNSNDGDTAWGTAVNYLGAWPAATSVTTSDWIVETNSSDSKQYVWKCTLGGVTGGSRPSGAGGFDTTSHGQTTVVDGADVLWQRRGIFKGAWAGTTLYGIDIAGNQINIYKHYVTFSTLANKLVPWSYARTGTFQTTSSEPAWSGAATGSRWIEGAILWIQGKNLFGGTGDPTDQEQLVLTGLLAPSGAKNLRITNGGTGTQTVVLADHAGMTDPQNSNPFVRVATDADSSAGNRFNFGGRHTDKYIVPGAYVDLTYDTNAAVWNATGGGGAPASADEANTSVEAGGNYYHGH